MVQHRRPVPLPPAGICSMHGTMKTNRGEVIRIDLEGGGIRLRCRADGRVTGKSKPNRDGIAADTLTYSGKINNFGELTLIEDHGGPLVRFDGRFTDADNFSSFCGLFTDSTSETCVSGRFDLKVDFPKQPGTAAIMIREGLNRAMADEEPVAKKREWGQLPATAKHYMNKQKCSSPEKRKTHQQWCKEKESQLRQQRKQQGADGSSLLLDPVPMNERAFSPDGRGNFVASYKDKSSPLHTSKAFGKGYSPAATSASSRRTPKKFSNLEPPSSWKGLQGCWQGLEDLPSTPLEQQPRWYNGLFLQSYLQHCSDIPMAPIEALVAQVNAAVDKNVHVQKLLVEYVSEEVQDLGVRAIAMSLKHLTFVKSLTIAGTRMRHFGARFLGEVIPSLHHLTHLEVSDGCIKDDGCIALAQAIGSAPSMTSLNLSNCLIEDRGAKALATLIIEHTGLRSLTLGTESNRNLLNDAIWCDDPRELDKDESQFSYSKYIEVLKQAFVSIRMPRTVRPVSEATTFCNQIGPVGAKAIYEAVAQNTTLTSLDLIGNPLGDKTIEEMFVALSTNTTLQELCLSCWMNDQPTLTAEAIAAMMSTLEAPSCAICLVDLGGLALIKSEADLERNWSRSTVAKPQRVSASSPKAAKSPSRGNAHMQPKAGIVETGYPSVSNQGNGQVVSGNFLFRSPAVAKEVLTEEVQAQMVQAQAPEMKQELAGLLQGERVIPQRSQSVEDLHGQVARLDNMLNEATKALEKAQHDYQLDLGAEPRVKQCQAQVNRLEQSVRDMIDSHEWRTECWENASRERSTTGWGPPLGRTHPQQQETVVAFGKTTRVDVKDRLPFGDRVFLEQAEPRPMDGRKDSFVGVPWSTQNAYHSVGYLKHCSEDGHSFPCKFFMTQDKDTGRNYLSLSIKDGLKNKKKMVQILPSGVVNNQGNLGLSSQFEIIQAPAEDPSQFSLLCTRYAAKGWYLGCVPSKKSLQCDEISEGPISNWILLDSVGLKMMIDSEHCKLSRFNEDDADSSTAPEEAEVEMDDLLLTALDDFEASRSLKPSP